MKLFGKKKKKENRPYEEPPVNYLRRGIISVAVAALWPVLIVALFLHEGRLTETIVLSVIIPIVFVYNAISDFRMYKAERAEKKKLKQEQKK